MKLIANRKELALLRGKRSPQALELWTQAFGQGDEARAKRYALAVATFLGQPPPGEREALPSDYFGQYSPNTRAAYAYAVTEFFEWVANKHQRAVAPEKITRLDAEGYVNWLANRSFSLAEEKLKDGDQDELLQLFEIVKSKAPVKLVGVVASLSPDLRKRFFGDRDENIDVNRRLLSHRVRKLVLMGLVRSTPSMSVLRKQHSQAGITQWQIPVGTSSVSIDELFTYDIPEPKPTSRATIAQRVSALSAFWRVLMQGENTPGGAPLLQYDVWDTVKGRVSRGLASAKKEASRRKKLPADVVIQMMREAPSDTLLELRNKAILYLMVFAGVRTSELLELRRARPAGGNWRAWFDGSEPPAMQILRKGNKVQRLPYPPVALKPLIEFQAVLDKLAAPATAQSTDPDGEDYYEPGARAWYFRDLTLPDAPLFPPLDFWGNNSPVDYRKAMSRRALFAVLRSVAQRAGVDAELVQKVHPHAIRHFAANAMVVGGKDIREVQTILGHNSVTTTETYLEDPAGDVKLSGQDAVLQYLNVKGVPVQPTYVGDRQPPVERRAPEVVETFAVEAETDTEPDESVPQVTEAELQVIEQLNEQMPANELPQAPPEYDPEFALHATQDGGVVVEDKSTVVGIDREGDGASVLLEDHAQTMRDDHSIGSPTWVYEQLANPKGERETVIFNRGGERDKAWLEENYPKLLPNFGVGQESLLPWYVKAQGNITRSGFFKGVPPFPVFSPEQCNPETTTGAAFVRKLEERYSKLVHGDPDQGVLPSPMRSVGIVRWYSFFVYHAERLQEHFGKQMRSTIPQWKPWDSVVEIRNLRAHEDEWLLQWLSQNAHTYRASVDAMKRGVERGSADVTESFLKASFEGIDLVSEPPEWLIYDDPVRKLYEDSPREWLEMIAWLKNVTGQKLDTSRKVDRSDQEQFAKDERKTRAKNIRDILLRVIKHIDKLESAKHTGQKDKIREYRDQLRQDLVWYILAAAGKQRLKHTLDALKEMNTKEFNQAMSAEYGRLGVPNPNAEPYKSLRGKKKVSAIVAALFPEIPELASANIFAESQLFNPRWFRIDEENKTIYVEEQERERVQNQFGQDPELLVRRACRAMWESRSKGHDALWGVMLSYFSWIMPTGKEMESQVLGIPVADLGDEALNVQARKNWLKHLVKRMKAIASGETITKPQEEEDEPEWKKFLREEEGSSQDALDYVASDAVDFLSSYSIDSVDTPEELYLQAEKSYYEMNKRRRGLVRNGGGAYVHLEGERPTTWYRVDLYGKRRGHFRPNAPPVVMSPGAVYLSQKRVFPARQLLPSPFRMVSAMQSL